MVHQEILRNLFVGFPVPAYNPAADQFIQTVPKETHENFTALAGKQAGHIFIVLLQMLQQVAENRLRRASVRIQPVGMRAVFHAFDNVPENALLILRDHTRGKDERIFIYEDDKQIWY